MRSIADGVGTRDLLGVGVEYRKVPSEIAIGLQLLPGQVQEICILDGIGIATWNGHCGGHSGGSAGRYRRTALDDDPGDRQEADTGLDTTALRSAIEYKRCGAVRGEYRLGGPVKCTRYGQEAVHRQ